MLGQLRWASEPIIYLHVPGWAHHIIFGFIGKGPSRQDAGHFIEEKGLAYWRYSEPSGRLLD